MVSDCCASFMPQKFLIEFHTAQSYPNRDVIEREWPFRLGASLAPAWWQPSAARPVRWRELRRLRKPRSKSFSIFSTMPLDVPLVD